ncbi:MAG: PQQ-binding-like beta-propeller repeat protein [Thermodesulfovibrionales bacterium]|nr:PQQ-binding-like beta-propeller repeat protein [Thermodesulfovibrionales bacterium]
MKKILILVAAIIFFITPTFSLGGGIHPWPMYGGDAKRTGQTFVHRGTNGIIKWKVYVGRGVTFSSVVVGADGTIYSLGDDGISEYLHAIKPNGVMSWSLKLGSLINYRITTPLLGDDGTVYVISSSGYLIAATPRGKLKWKIPVGRIDGVWPNNSPVMFKGILYVATEDGTPGLRAVSQTGQVIWHYNEPALSPAVGDDGTIYCLVGNWNNRRLAAFSREGEMKWEVYLGQSGAGPVVHPDGSIIIAHPTSEGGAISAYYPDGTLRWQALISDDSLWASKPFIGTDGTIYIIGSGSDFIYAFDIYGNLISKKMHDCLDGTGLVDADGNIYLASGVTNGIVSMTNKSSMSREWLKVLWQTQTISGIGGYWTYPSAPAIGIDGTIYHINDNGYLFAIGSQDP